MKVWDWLKVIALILLPINAWLGVHLYLYWQKQRAYMEGLKAELEGKELVRRFVHEKILNLKEGQIIRYPFPYPFIVLGSHPPIRKGFPVLFLNISTIAEEEIWDLAIKEALNASPYLYVVLIHKPRRLNNLSKIQSMLKSLYHPRLSALAGEWIYSVFGQGYIEGGILLVLCDGNGIVRAVEPYPKLKKLSSWEEEVADWRSKLHQAVKKVLDKFFPKRAP